MNELEKRGAKRPKGFVRSDGLIWCGDHWMSPQKLLEKRAKDAELKRARRAVPEYLERERESRRRHYYKHQAKILQTRREITDEEKSKRAERSRAWRIANIEKVKQAAKMRNRKGGLVVEVSGSIKAKRASKWNKELEDYKTLRHIERHKKEVAKNNSIIASRMRTRLRSFLTRKGKYKAHGTMFYVGCTHEQLRMHIESQFKRGMSWDNYGKVWHIDHIVPVSLFGTNEDELKRAMNWQNLRPLWARQNIVEGNRRQNNQTVLPLAMP